MTAATYSHLIFTYHESSTTWNFPLHHSTITIHLHRSMQKYAFIYPDAAYTVHIITILRCIGTCIWYSAYQNHHCGVIILSLQKLHKMLWLFLETSCERVSLTHQVQIPHMYRYERRMHMYNTGVLYSY